MTIQHGTREGWFKHYNSRTGRRGGSQAWATDPETECPGHPDDPTVTCANAYRAYSTEQNRKRGHKPQQPARHATDRGYQIHLTDRDARPERHKDWGTNDECPGRIVDPANEGDAEMAEYLKMTEPALVTCREAKRFYVARWRRAKTV